jgi:hypothetical protein
MTEETDSLLQPLAKAFQEVAFRANRLREWMEFEPLLRNVENRFAQFYSSVVQTATASDFAAKSSAMKDTWSLCQEIDMIDLQVFRDGIQHINRPLTTSAVVNPDPSTEISALIDIGKTIQTSLEDISFSDLKTNSKNFQMSLKALMSNRRNIVKKEVQELCELTIRLRAEFKL